MEISLALEIARNIREIAVIKDERRSKRWIFPVFAAGRLKSESASMSLQSNQSENSEMNTTFLRSSPVPDRSNAFRSFERSRAAPPRFVFSTMDACLPIDAHVRSLKSGSFLYVSRTMPAATFFCEGVVLRRATGFTRYSSTKDVIKVVQRRCFVRTNNFINRLCHKENR